MKVDIFTENGWVQLRKRGKGEKASNHGKSRRRGCIGQELWTVP